MKAVRVGALRGRWSRWCSRLSPVIQASMNGQHQQDREHQPAARSGSGSRRSTSIVKPKMLGLPARHDPQRPSGQPMYQSGWEPAVTLVGS